MGISTFDLALWVFIAQRKGKKSAGDSLFDSSATFVKRRLEKASRLILITRRWSKGH